MEILKKNKFKYDPKNLPRALDFNLMTIDLPLDRSTKTKIQLALSKMDYKQLKETIEYLGDMRYTAANAQRYKLAAYTKAVKTFVEEYFKSVKEQKRV